MSSRVLFFSLDCAGGAGPVVEAPRDCVGADDEAAAVVGAAAPGAANVAAGAEVEFVGAEVVVVDVDSAGFEVEAPPNSEGVG